MTKEEYLKRREQIKNDPHLSDTQKKILLFNHWIDYVHDSVAASSNEELKYVSESVRVYA